VGKPNRILYLHAVNRIDRRKREITDRILQAAFDLFLAQGVAATTIEEICDRANVANRTFFNHFPTRQAMVAALAHRRMTNVHDLEVIRINEPVPARIIGMFDDIAAALLKSSDAYRQLISEMMATAGQGTHRGLGLHNMFVEIIEGGVARGEVTTRHDPKTLADIIISALSGPIGNWTVDPTYALGAHLHQTARALADLLSFDTVAPPLRPPR
jgi:AcrR family transcriptional regulator